MIASGSPGESCPGREDSDENNPQEGHAGAFASCTGADKLISRTVTGAGSLDPSASLPDLVGSWSVHRLDLTSL